MAKKSSRLPLVFFSVVFAVVIIGGSALLLSLNIVGSQNQIALMLHDNPVSLTSDKPVVIGKGTVPILSVTNPKNAVCIVRGVFEQEGKTLTVIDTHLPKILRLSEKSARKMDFPLDLSTFNLSEKFKEGILRFTVFTEDCASLSKPLQQVFSFSFDLTPPRVEVTSSQHYINQGGANVVTYQLSQDATGADVRVGGRRFRAHKIPGTPETARDYFSFFVYSYDLPPDTPIEIVAWDGAQNEAKTRLTPSKFFPKTFRKCDSVATEDQCKFAISDAFISNKISAIIENTPELSSQGDPVKNFLLVNSDLRSKNAAFLVELSKKSEEKFLWKDAFIPMMNAAIEANFADYRHYYYNDQKIDEQVHLGFDLATVQQDAVKAANSGKVLFADYLGIYGNTIIIDHGYGLTTLYGHLSRMDVKVGDAIAKDQKIGNTGVTGLAGGDHLHFSLLIDGVQTNPVEFWDQHWIDDQVYLRLPKDYFGRP